jgi:hypothetical protein
MLLKLVLQRALEILIPVQELINGWQIRPPIQLFISSNISVCYCTEVPTCSEPPLNGCIASGRLSFDKQSMAGSKRLKCLVSWINSSSFHVTEWRFSSFVSIAHLNRTDQKFQDQYGSA